MTTSFDLAGHPPREESDMPMKTVLVTGSSGYIAKHIVLQLLNAGYSVRGSVRSLARSREVEDAVRPHLVDPSAIGRLTFVELDLEKDAGWARAMEGVDVLMHTASPFPMTQPRNAEDLIRPAVDGALRALRAAKAAGIRRVILTASVACVMYAGFPRTRAVYTEEDWTDGDLTALTPYVRSKTLAERAAWAFVRQEAPEMRLTTINPGFVLGAPLDDHFGTSMELVQRFLAGKDPMVPQVMFPIVDVRDVAAMHVNAIDKPAAEGRRFLGSGGMLSFREIALALKGAFPDQKVVTRQAPNVLIRLIGVFDRSVGTILPDLGRTFQVSSKAARDVLNIDFVDPRTTVADSGRFMVNHKKA
jgi:dihydroflavonol-4-reductase